MKYRTPLAAAIIAGTLLAGPALAQTMPPAVISVTGEATVSVAPDLAQIDGGVTSEAKTAREASDANNAAMGKVLLALKGAGIEEKDFQTSRLSLQPQSAPNRTGTGPSAIVGYRASNHVTIRLRDVTKVANVIDTLVAAGANDIGGINLWCHRLRNFSMKPANKPLPMPAARPRFMRRPPASRLARRSASPRKVHPVRHHIARWWPAWPPPLRWRRAKRRFGSR